MADEAPAVPTAAIERKFVATTVNVVTPDDPAVKALELHLFYGQLAPGQYLFSEAAELTADLAVALGQHLVTEGRRLKHGLVVPGTTVPADLRRG